MTDQQLIGTLFVAGVVALAASLALIWLPLGGIVIGTASVALALAMARTTRVEP